MRRDDVIQRLLKSEDPSIRWKTRVGVLDEDRTSRGIKRIQQEVRDGPVVRSLLARRDTDGRIHARRWRMELRQESGSRYVVVHGDVAADARACDLRATRRRYEGEARRAQGGRCFLSRRLFKRRTDGSVIARGFIALHYPVYWHYDILAGLRAMAELDLIRTPRCADALDVLEQKEIDGIGWVADERFFKASSKLELSGDYVNWGSTSKKTMNEWITAAALSVLHAAGRC